MHEKERNVVKCHSHCCIFGARVKCIYQLRKENKHNIAYVCNTCVAYSALVLMLMLVLWMLYARLQHLICADEWIQMSATYFRCVCVRVLPCKYWLVVCVFFFHVLLCVFFSLSSFLSLTFSRRFIWCLCQLFRVVGICGLGCMLQLCLFVISLTFIGVHK